MSPGFASASPPFSCFLPGRFRTVEDRSQAKSRSQASRRQARRQIKEKGYVVKNRIVSPQGLAVMGTALVLGGFVAPLFAFLGAAFIGGAVQARFEDRRRRMLPMSAARRRAF